MSEWLSVKEAATRLKMSSRTIYRKIKVENIPTRKEDGRILVDVTALAQAEESDKSPSLLVQLKSENEYLRQRLAQVQGLLESERHRHDALVAGHLNNLKLMLEAPKKQPFWRKLFRKQLPPHVVDVGDDDT